MLHNFTSTKPVDSLLAEPDTLAVLSFGQEAHDGSVPLKLFIVESDDHAADQRVEVWKTDTCIINSGVQDNFRWRCCNDYLFISVDIACEVCDDLEAISEQAYQGILDIVGKSDYQKLLRFCNVLPRINVGEGDNENYKRFCNGRLKAFDTFNIKPSEYPAATAIGHYGNGITVYAIATRLNPEHIGNSRQAHAFEYPREYGPSSPSFARATSLLIPDTDQQLFFISGTASILGHKTVHPADLDGQLHTTHENILFLLTEAGLKREDILSLRVYLRHPADAKTVRDTIDVFYPGANIVITHADICRADLLVEIECFCVAA